MIFSQSLVALVATFGLMATADAAQVWNPVINTSKGQISGVQGSSARRFTMPYAQPPVGSLRFSRPQALTHFNSTGIYDGKQLPKACLQNDSTGQRDQSEDCLFMNIFTPNNIPYDSRLPVMVWVHGGSFNEGGIADIDGSNLAASQNMIVVTVQYRLGMFGWLKWPRYRFEGNYGLRDLIMALEVVKQDIGNFGGDASKVTLAGQSSGAQMVNALLSTPSASSLFQRAIVQSAPLDYSPQSAKTAEAVAGNLVLEQLPRSDRTKMFEATGFTNNYLLDAQQNITNLALLNGLPGVPQAEAFNVVLDGNLISGDTNSIANSGKQVIYTTVKDEACVAVFGGIQIAQGSEISPSDFEGLVGYSFPSRAQAIIDSKAYQPAADADEATIADDLVQLTTDFAWTCATQRNALASAGGSTVYVGEFDLGIPTPMASYVPTCQGKVAHEDDIAVVFNTPSSALSSAQTSLVKEVQARWGAFVRTGNPNPSGYSKWPALPANGGLEVLQLGANSNGGSSLATSQRTDACKLYSSI